MGTFWRGQGEKKHSIALHTWLFRVVGPVKEKKRPRNPPLD